MRVLGLPAVLAAVMVLSGCANSVINDPVEMERRRAYVERQQAAHERFWGRMIGPEQRTASRPRGGSPGLHQFGARTPSQCRAIGGTWNYGSNVCWRL